MYLDYAEMQAARGKAMTMKDWIVKLNAFLKFSEYDILTNAGKISHEVAEALALKEYEKFRVEQDKIIFPILIARLKNYWITKIRKSNMKVELRLVYISLVNVKQNNIKSLHYYS